MSDNSIHNKTILTCTITIDHSKVTKPPKNVNTSEELHQYFADLFNEGVLEGLLGVDDIDQVNEIDGVSVEIGDRLEGEAGTDKERDYNKEHYGH